ncbi:unnamed protein product, partial [Heterosigma akashiwo]
GGPAAGVARLRLRRAALLLGRRPELRPAPVLPRCYRTGMRLKSAIITIVYQKALRIKPGQTS